MPESDARSVHSSVSILQGRPRPSGVPSLISLMVSVDVKHHVYILTYPPAEVGKGFSLLQIAQYFSERGLAGITSFYV